MLGVGLIWLGCALLAAQEPPKEVVIRTHPYTPPSAILRANTSLVETPLIVRDSNFKDTNDLAGATRLAADPEGSYGLGFSAGDPDGKFHAMKIRFQEKHGDQLEYRSGYFFRLILSRRNRRAHAWMTRFCPGGSSAKFL